MKRIQEESGDVEYVILKCKRGNTKAWDIYFKDEDDNPINITNYTIYLVVKELLTDSVPVISKTITTHTDPISGETQISLTRDDTLSLSTGSYEYSITYNDSDTDEVVTFIEGELIVESGVRE